MKEKLLAVLKPLIANKGLSKDEVESLADMFGQNLTDTSTDEEISNVANSIVPIAELMQKSSSRQVSAIQDKFKDYVPKPAEPSNPPTPPTPPAPEPPTPPTPGMTSEEVKKMIDDAIKPYQEKERQAKLNSLLMSNEKVAKIPEFFRKNYSLDSEENLDNVVSKMETEFAAAKQEMLKSGAFVQPSLPNGEGETDDLIQRLHEMADVK